MTDAPLLPGLSSAEARRIDQICDRFEAAWKAGQRPVLEEYLRAAGEPERSVLLRQLLLLDWDFRRRAGDRPAGGDYLARFPGDQALIDAVGREMNPHADDTPSPAGLEGMVPKAPVSGSARYELLQEVGHGGAGVVFRGRDRLLGRELAVKVLRDVYHRAPDFCRRFVEEARVGSRLQHPAIVPVYELGWFDDRRPYFTMKLVEGRTLGALLKERADPSRDWPRLLGVFEQVCQAMAYAHAQGVVHRDLKPANIMVGAFGEVQVMDWGFAKVLGGEGEPHDGPSAAPTDGETGASRSGVMMGTPAYMPPEQARGEADRIDPRADVFALGAILCEILTGRPPYVGAFPAVCRMAAQGELADACKRLDACGADASLRALARRCLAPDRDARPADAGGVARDVAVYLTSAQEQVRQAQLERAAAEARAAEARGKAKAERRARRLTLALAAAAVVLAAAAGFVWLQYDRFRQAQSARTAAVDSKIEAALVETDERIARGDWSGAGAAATRAKEFLDSGASSRWKPRADEVRSDLDIVNQLDEIHARHAIYDFAAQRSPSEKLLPRYAEAFARYGIHPDDDPAQVAARLAGRPATVRDALLVGLDNWSLIAARRKDRAANWLRAVLQAADKDVWRNQVRDAVATGNRHTLEALAREVDLASQPPAAVTSLSWALLDMDAYEAVIALLRPAQRQYPGDYWINLDLGQALLLRDPKDYAEPLRFLTVACALRPNFALYTNLSSLLSDQKDWDGAASAAQKAIDMISEGDPAARGKCYCNLGVALWGKGDGEAGEAAFRKAVELDPQNIPAHGNLGLSLILHGHSDEAIPELQRAIELGRADRRGEGHEAFVRFFRWQTAKYQFGLGNIQFQRKAYDAALAAFDDAIAMSPEFADAHVSRGDVFLAEGKVDEAIAAYGNAVHIDPNNALALSNLGLALSNKGWSDRAVPLLTRAAELNGRWAENQYRLGRALDNTGNLDAAAAAYHKAVDLEPNHAGAHYQLGLLLLHQARYAEALPEIERGHRLGSARPDWQNPSAQSLKMAQRLVDLEAHLPVVLARTEEPPPPGEQLEYAALCKSKGLYAASARLYASALSADPALATAPAAGSRYEAACVAAQAGSGRGRDAGETDPAERARWRRRAIDWLRADLTLLSARPDSGRPDDLQAASTLQRWRSEKALSAVREPEELAKLPESERADYMRFWNDVRELLVRRLAGRPAE
jgi:serine/threonine-protein kinase